MIIEIIQSLLLNHNRIKLEINKRKIARKSQNIWKLNNIFLNNTQAKEEISKESVKYLKLSDNENTAYHKLWDAVKAIL